MTISSAEKEQRLVVKTIVVRMLGSRVRASSGSQGTMYLIIYSLILKFYHYDTLDFTN